MDGSDIGTQSGLRIGRVIAVSASQAVALLERCDASGDMDRAWPVEMGALVKMHTRVSTVYGMVSGLRVPLPNLAPSDQELKVVERFERTGPSTMQYTATVTDPKTWTRPWTVSLPLKLHPDYQFFEYACHEGNYAMKHILSGARSDEKLESGRTVQ